MNEVEDIVLTQVAFCSQNNKVEKGTFVAVYAVPLTVVKAQSHFVYLGTQENV